MSGLQKGSGPLSLEKNLPREDKNHFFSDISATVKNISSTCIEKIDLAFYGNSSTDTNTHVVGLRVGTADLQPSRFTNTQLLDFLKDVGVQITFCSIGMIEAKFASYELIFYPDNITAELPHEIAVDSFSVQVKHIFKNEVYEVSWLEKLPEGQEEHTFSSVEIPSANKEEEKVSMIENTYTCPKLTLPMIKKLIKQLGEN